MESDFAKLFHEAKSTATEQRWQPLLKHDEYTTADIIIDVRSPVEFEKGHLPYAHNIPLLSNEEREAVGKLFKKEGRDAAVVLGLEFVEQKVADLAKQFLQLCGGHQRILIYCFRGGMRSSSVCYFASKLLPERQIFRLDGGHKRYRTFVLNFVPTFPFILITGQTGSGKTHILHELAKQNEQIIDLEKLARHRGSAYGLLGNERQPARCVFQAMLVHKIRALDQSKVVFLEHEHTRIGSCHLPDGVANYLCAQPSGIIHVHKSVACRVGTILEEYGSFDADSLCQCTKKIKKRFGGQKQVDLVNDLIRQGKLDEAVPYLLVYYDKLYGKGLEKRMKQVETDCKVEHITFDDNDYASQAEEVRRLGVKMMVRKQRGMSSLIVMLSIFACLFFAKLVAFCYPH